MTKKKHPRHRSRLESVSDVLSKTLKYKRLDKKLKQVELFPEWEEIVGAKIAKISKPNRLLGSNILELEVIDSVWAQELSMRKAEILDKIHASGKGAPISDIRFVVGIKKL